MSDRLAGKHVLVTGASRGIGRAIAERFAAEGADLSLAATTAERTDDTAAACEALGARTARLGGDVADPETVEALLAEAETALGPLHGIVNNAGVWRGAKFTDYDPDTFRETLRVNVEGVFYAMQSALRRFSARGYGKIVNIASTAGRFESPNQAAYNASKHAVVGLTKCAALEHAAEGITVNAICPGFVDTDMVRTLAGGNPDLIATLAARTPMGRILEPAEIADLAVYLASDESRGMTGQCIVISGGMRMA